MDFDRPYIKEQLLFSIANAEAEGHTVKPGDTVEVFPNPLSSEMTPVTISDYTATGSTHKKTNNPSYTGNNSTG